jgi:benzoyl-CoA reductase/2-hydroxyglutaryl-CoA dehydratase subunit BcrC/BadD/HgdB
MDLQSSIKKMLLENPDPSKIGRGISFLLLKTLFRPVKSFGSKSEKKMALKLYNYVRKIFKHPDRAVFTSLFAPVELLHGFGYRPFSLEIFAAVAASMGIASDLLSETEKNWLSTDFCSFHRAHMAVARMGLLPRPRFLLATSHTCDGTMKSFSETSSVMGSPLIFLDTPYTLSSDSIAYLAGQIEEAAEEIEEITGKRLNMGNLEKVFSYSNRARDIMYELNRIRQSEKYLIYGDETLNIILAWGVLLGTREGVTLFKNYRDELLKRKNSGFSEIKGKKRILWLHLKPYFKNDLIGYLERELGAVIIAEEINSVTWKELDIRKPWESLALKLVDHYWVGTADKRLDNIKRMVEDYKVDGVIHFSHWGCRQSNGAVRLIRDAVAEYGIPFLNLDGDCIDERSFSKGQYLTRLEGFMEIMG